MPKFHVMCSETVWYRVEVEADTAEEARQCVETGMVDLGEPYDGANFEIDEVVALEETV
jgi:hypothetical protein